MSALVYIGLGLTQSPLKLSDDALVNVLGWTIVLAYAGLAVIVVWGTVKILQISVGFPINIQLLKAGVDFLPQHIQDEKLTARLLKAFTTYFPPSLRKSGKFLVTATITGDLIELALSDATGTQIVNSVHCRTNAKDFDPLFRNLIAMPVSQFELFATIRDN